MQQETVKLSRTLMSDIWAYTLEHAPRSVAGWVDEAGHIHALGEVSEQAWLLPEFNDMAVRPYMVFQSFSQSVPNPPTRLPYKSGTLVIGVDLSDKGVLQIKPYRVTGNALQAIKTII